MSRKGACFRPSLAWPVNCSVEAKTATKALVVAFELVASLQYSSHTRLPPNKVAQAIMKLQADILYKDVP